MVLHEVNRGVPPFFGDLVSVENGQVEFANCGAGSLFWAGFSNKPEVSFPGVEAVSNIHGNSGAAFNYFSGEAPEVTVARLTRINGTYYMQLGKGRAPDSKRVLKEKLGERERDHLAGRWGKLIVDLGVDAENFVRVIGANHLHATLGDVTEEVRAACRQWNIPVVRLDSDDEMVRFYEDLKTGTPRGVKCQNGM
jgi:L-fucose isomerase-like protein